MTKEECKQLLADTVNRLGGVRTDQLVAWRELYNQKGFSEIFHPDIIPQIVMEGLVTEIKYSSLDGRNFSFLIPKGSKISIMEG